MFRRGVHDERDQRLARPEDKNREQDPRRNVGLFFMFMDMGMLGFMAVKMLMRSPVGVEMDVFVRFIFNSPVQAPEKIGQAKADQEPCRGSTARRLGVLQPGDRDPEGDPDQTQDDRAEHVPQPGQERNKERFGKRPAPGAAHGDEGNVVVGAEDGVDKADRRRRSRQDQNFFSDHYLV